MALFICHWGAHFLSTICYIFILPKTDGVSPTEIFGLDRNQMEKILNGLTINYPDFLNASFTLDLDNITLNSEKTSQDVLNLF